ncbi:MAG: L-aspartate oxidase, partial [Cyanobacteria bacterium J06642_11]
TQAMDNIQPNVTHQLPAQLTAKNLRIWTETRNLLAVAHLVLQSALFRTESRGGHYRSDYPHEDSHWQVHTLVTDLNWSQSEER